MELSMHSLLFLYLCCCSFLLTIARSQEQEGIAQEFLTLTATLAGLADEHPVQISVKRTATDDEIMSTALEWSAKNDPERRPNNIATIYHTMRNMRDGIVITKQWMMITGAHTAFTKFLLPVAAKAKVSTSPLQILEVGSYEGASAIWITDNMLEHPESRLLCIDIWSPELPTDEGDDMDMVRSHFVHNLKTRGKGKVEAWQGDSLRALSALVVDNKRYDVIYIDGSHQMADVAADALMAFRLLKPGGLMIFDDYGAGNDNHTHIRRGIDILIDGLSEHLTVVQREYILVIQKISDRFSMVSQQVLAVMSANE